MDVLQEPDSYDIYAPPHAHTSDPTHAAHEPVFFPVGLAKLAVLSVCTLGVYIVCWFYKSWRQAPGRSGRSASAAAAALFCPLTAYFLFRKIERFDAPSSRPVPGRAMVLALCFFLFSMAGQLPDPYGLLCLLAFVPLLPVVQRVNGLNTVLHPLADRNTRFSPANVVGALGGLILLAAVAEMIWGQSS
jgi:hypothetical protein